MPRSSLSEAQRRAILADLECPIMGSGTDHEIADEHGVTPRDVRVLRAALRRDQGVARILALGRELAALSDSDMSPGETVELVMHEAVARARKRAESREDVGARRSADGARRSRTPAQVSGGVSGDRGPRRRLPRGAAGATVGRRVGAGPAVETREGRGEGVDG